MILTEVSFKVNIEALCLRWESSIIGSSLLLFRVAALTGVVRHLLDRSIKLAFKHAHSIDGALGDKFSQSGVSSSQLINRD